ncbi:SH3 domain-containing protein [Desulfatitalea alkaliphila]|uniref:SH3 domain-containing protein n=1 Tax=Desulfatitalea alkaliphila TaxID=2929485 RepID=A0AA41R6H3_9BACT|nr:SH3 domain-containing protein [Desulfatitalea alkaliphila]MCJ8502070.1 SH3 domain-containing protein [Desulfatitalea alkaliphila]
MTSALPLSVDLSGRVRQRRRRLWQAMAIALSALFFFAGMAQAAERLAVSADIANIRSGPGVGKDLLWQVEKYHPVLVVERRDGWVRFKDFEGDEGWISAALLDDTPSVIVKVNRCNVRGGPGTAHPVRFTAERGIPFKVLGTQGDWIEVVHADGDRGWVLNTLIW